MNDGRVVPTPEDIEFAVAVYEANGDVPAAGRKLFGTTHKWPAQKAYRVWKRPEVQLAYEAVQDRNEQQVRTWCETFGAGYRDRIEKVCLMVDGHGEPTCSDRLNLIKYLDEREGRVAPKQSGGASVTVNILEALVLGRGQGAPADNRGAGFPGFRSLIPVDPDQD
jgi:hypothetical protein